eukprot:gnl/TRDRNA2_/TRDRNA2_170605_c0_seq3.p1 gnl/TRDRNA2_/TRDRNA2_170605_c0~~gnl/TRDRNA2_/TRDRNA2_170605_c0_seq3.p1  ORF type:complete len:540 (-),score=83.89 gnl/TRDRNA2_/TRDRNA2_170605_c0_seq3:91-1539(-)
MTVENPFPVPNWENQVHIHFNGMELAVLGQGKSQTFCLPIRPDDELTFVEVFSQIRVKDVKVTCGTPDAVPAAADAKCTVGTKVRWGASACPGQTASFTDGEIESIIDARRAWVRYGPPGKEKRRRWRAEMLTPVSQSTGALDMNRAARCASFEYQKPHIGIVIVADKNFQRSFAPQIATQKCFAQRHGYDVKILEGDEYRACDKFRGSFFFKKHCLIAKLLEEQAPGYVAFVIDGDVVATVYERGLEEWADNEADIQFYERVTQNEVAAGNYVAKNTPFARSVLMEWANFIDRRPRGYSSEDNGAIHILLIERLELKGAAHCADVYSKLVSNIPGGEEYFTFVNCALNLIGKPRTYHLRDGAITLWPRLHFFVADGPYTNFFASNDLGPVMHHGIKNPDYPRNHYFANLEKCELNEEKVLRPDEHFGLQVLRLARVYPQHFEKGDQCSQCLERCMQTLGCPPLKNSEDPVPVRTCTDCGKP